MTPMAVRVQVMLPDECLEELSQSVAKLVLAGLYPNEDSPYFTVDQAARYLGCRPQRIHDLTSCGRLSRYKEGGRTLVLRSEVDALVRLEREASRCA
jgi:excisionase family DNA binding protein